MGARNLRDRGDRVPIILTVLSLRLLLSIIFENPLPVFRDHMKVVKTHPTVAVAESRLCRVHI